MRHGVSFPDERGGKGMRRRGKEENGYGEGRW